MTAEQLTIETAAGPATVHLDTMPHPRALLAITHGAGGGVDTTDLLAVRDALTRERVAVARVVQPYRVAGRPAPAPSRISVQDGAWVEIMKALTVRCPEVPLIQGGRSNGARVACRTAADTRATAVVALAFPLHPPGKPERSRIAELDAVAVPVLVVQGARDPFGMPPQAAGRRIVVIDGEAHSFRRHVDAVAAAVRNAVLAWI